MGNTRGFKRDAECFKTLEQRRLKAARWLEQGVHQSEVARRVGVHRQSVSRWARQLEEAGRAGLKRAGRAGRKPKLSAADLKQIEQGLKRGPEALGYATSLWTSQRVAHLIEQECGIRYTPTHVWRFAFFSSVAVGQRGVLGTHVYGKCGRQGSLFARPG
jgi:transposase